MLNLLKNIVSTISSLVQFIINSIESLINLFLHLPDYIAFMTGSLDLLPSIIIPFCLASISIYVIYLVIGRGRS